MFQRRGPQKSMVRRSLHAALARRHVRSVVCLLLVGGSYYGAAKLGLSLSVSQGVITPVWPPSGIALASLLILGVRYWPAVAAAAFLANATGDPTVAVAAGIAVGNTMAAVAGAVLVQRIGFTPALDRVRSVLALVVGGAGVSTAIAATNGVTVLTIAGEREGTFGGSWLLWWFGDVMGILVLAPILLVLSDAAKRGRPRPAHLLEGVGLLLAIVAVSAIVFLAGAWRYPYLIFPFLLWAAIRFRQVGAAGSAFIVGVIGTWGAVDGSFPLSAETATERVQLAQASFAVVVVSLLVVGATLAEREAATRALAQTASRLTEAQALAHIGSWVWDVRKDVVTWSDELYRIFGVEHGSGPLTYETYLGLVHPDDRGFTEGLVRQAAVDGKPFAMEYRIVRPGGDERIVLGQGRVVLQGGEVVRMLGTAQDVTERRQVERLKEDILASVSHELRTPLTSVLGFALTLQKHHVTLTPETIDQTLTELVQAARRLERLLSDLLDVEQLRRGLVALRREQLDVGELVGRVVAECSLDDREVVIECEPVVAGIDRTKVERIVENLVVNAHKHTPTNGAIEVRLTARGRDLLLVVEDQGPGIPDEYKEVVFESFNRGPNILATTPGAGIGLTIVERFAAVHGGRCWIEDRAGGGASFRVLLPDCVSSAARPAGVP
jgi:PAS domain S-box-containing protein